MAYTSHGHYIMGSKKTGTPPKFKNRCYGNQGCTTCKKEISEYWKKHGAEPEKKEKEVVVNEDLLIRLKATTLVENYVVERLPEDQRGVKVEAYVLALTRAGDDWKAILSINTDVKPLFEVLCLSKLKVAKITAYIPTNSINVREGD